MASSSGTRRTVVVVGSGIAGIMTALHAADHHDVVLVSGGALSDANTSYAQGGIAAAIGGDDSVDAHIADTLRAGAGSSDPRAVRILCTEAPDRIRELLALGVPFDGTPRSPSLALEAAHSAARILHADGDATGAAIESTLLQVLRTGVSDVRAHTRLLDIDLREGVVSGVRLAGPAGISSLSADAVVLATGGFGGLYAHTSNPPSATGSGIAVALRAGAAVADLEFVQFHPTVLARSGGFLVSEAVRGEGAVLRNEHGERFMTTVHPDAELAPRDVVARAIAREMRRQGGRPVLLDATHLDGGALDARFPTIARRVRESGVDWKREPVPVTPAAHYTMGGVATDLDGRTSVPGLFAVGETARTGVHGANRLASNSLMEGAVFAVRAARALSDPDLPRLDIDESEVMDLPPAGDPIRPVTERERPTSLGDVLWNDVGLERSGIGLSRAIDSVRQLRQVQGDSDGFLVAEAAARAALAREESRGAHARTDFPASDPSLARPIFWRSTTAFASTATSGAPTATSEEAFAC